MGKKLLEMKNIKKIYYPDILAVEQATISINEGEIHAIAGENGAGKTTLMKILYGLEKPNKGEIFINNNKTTINSPNDAMNLKIGMVHQHFMLVEGMTVADNIVLGMEPKRKLLYDYKYACNLTKKLGDKYGMNIEPTLKISKLSVGLKQKVEIMKVLARDAKIIILDEPTAVLTPQETKELFHQLKLLKNANHTIIIITHKLREIKEICDRVTIMKSGKTIGTYIVADISLDEISKKMVGRDFKIMPFSDKTKFGKNILEVKNLTITNKDGKYALRDISFNVKEGQILGVVGVEGNGQSELAKAINGHIMNYEGIISVDGLSTRGKSIRDIRSIGVSHIPEDRMVEGVNLKGSIMESSVVLKVREDAYRKKMFLKRNKLIDYTNLLIESYNIKCDSFKDNVKSLSGGNIQKIVSAREINASKRLLVANQPTRGIDIGAVLTLHEKLRELQKEQKAILLISSDLKEIYDLAESVIVLYEGEIVARINNIQKISEEQLGRYMLGIDKDIQSEEIA